MVYATVAEYKAYVQDNPHLTPVDDDAIEPCPELGCKLAAGAIA